METSSVAAAVVGGMAIGAAGSALLFLNGRIAGISGIVGGLIPPQRGDVAWRVAFVAGLLAGGVALQTWLPSAFPAPHSVPPILVIVAGFLVGFGTRIGGGCTSGHGVCGLGRRSLRSLVATVTFMLTGIATVFLTEHVLWRQP